MIGQVVTDPKTGEPIDNNGNKISPSPYQPDEEVKRLFSRCQADFQVAWSLQNRSFNEFDGFSLLQRARMDQETFGAFVGAEFIPVQKRWRWRGRKNTARNKLIGILAHMIAGMLFPYVYAKNGRDEEDEMTARVMRILVEDYLKKADYELKFLFIVLSALVNPAVFVNVEYVEAVQLIKTRLAGGEIKVEQAVDELLSGLNLNVVPIDEVLLGDFYSGHDIQRQPYVVRARRISYDDARNVYGGDPDFKFVQAGKTRVVITGANSEQTLYDIEWTEADGNFVQELTFFYRAEDIEVKWVGGVLMGSKTNVYNSNPFSHRRMTLQGEEWKSVPIYPFAKSGFEPIDPAGRFSYYKSGAFKEYWDALGQDRMHQIAYDGTFLDVIKPLFVSGAANINNNVLVPGATTSLPQNASVMPYQLGPNLAAALNMMNVEKADMSESTQDKIMSGNVEKGVTAYATAKAEQNARVFLGVFGIFIADLVRQVGELTMDCIIQHATIGDLDATAPGALSMKYKTYLAKGKEKGKSVTNRIVFTDKYMGRSMTEDQVRDREWELENKAGTDSDQLIFEVNPYQFARTTYSMFVDADRMVMRSMGTDRQQKALAFQMMTDPRVAPFTDQEAVVEDFVIDEFSDGDPERYKKKGNSNEMLASVMGAGMPPQNSMPLPAPVPNQYA